MATKAAVRTAQVANALGKPAMQRKYTQPATALPEVNFSDFGDVRYLHLGTPWV